jgi:molecular chaperone DnaK (HSP70)
VPNYYNLAEENALRNAAKIAGFNSVNIVSEAVALALSYGFFRRKDMFKKEQ